MEASRKNWEQAQRVNRRAYVTEALEELSGVRSTLRDALHLSDSEQAASALRAAEGLENLAATLREAVGENFVVEAAAPNSGTVEGEPVMLPALPKRSPFDDIPRRWP